MDDNGFFWWFEYIDQVMDWDTRSAKRYAWEVMGASKRQERLELQRSVLHDIGQEHSWAGPASYQSQSWGGVEHPDGTLPHQDDAPYQEQSEVVHTLPDKWTIRRLRTFGDLKYEGTMMTHCIKEDADGQTCGECDGSGNCGDCEEGRSECGECYGSGRFDCAECGGEGKQDCRECSDSSTSTTYKCDHCKGSGKVDKCRSCGYEKEQHDFANPTIARAYGQVGPEAKHEWQPQKGDCNHCFGAGERTITEYTPGKVDCDECEGTGKDDEGDECDTCDGEGKQECGECNGTAKQECEACIGEGREDCSECGGEGYSECGTCEGSGLCGECSGNGRTGTGDSGPDHYYRAFSRDEADALEHAPGGPLSLRDEDNVPSVSFLEDNHNPKEIYSVFGRQDKMPVAEHQHRILRYMKSRLAGEGQIPGMEEKCSACSGNKEVPAKGLCGSCGGTGRWGGLECSECAGSGNKDIKVSCGRCKGTGEDTVGVSWATQTSPQRFTRGDIDSILNGEYNRPDVMLLAQHKENKNEVHTLGDVGRAGAFGKSYAPVHEEGGTRAGEARELYDLHAVPSIAIGKDSTIYNPAQQAWEVKSGRGSKLPLETAGAKVPWEAVMEPKKETCQSCDGKGYLGSPDLPRPGDTACVNCMGHGEVKDHEALHRTRAQLPEFVQSLFPKVASKELSGWK